MTALESERQITPEQGYTRQARLAVLTKEMLDSVGFGAKTGIDAREAINDGDFYCYPGLSPLHLNPENARSEIEAGYGYEYVTASYSGESGVLKLALAPQGTSEIYFAWTAFIEKSDGQRTDAFGKPVENVQQTVINHDTHTYELPYMLLLLMNKVRKEPLTKEEEAQLTGAISQLGDKAKGVLRG